MDIKDRALEIGAVWCSRLKNNEQAYIVPLAFHVAIYIYPESARDFSEYSDRYCILTIELARKAIAEYEETGTMKYWQKHHNRSISIVGNKAFRSGELEIEENILYEVSWGVNILEKEYGRFISINY